MSGEIATITIPDGPPSGATRADVERALQLALADELANVIYDADAARAFCGRLKFPRSRIPVFRTSGLFWPAIVQGVFDGVTPGGLLAMASLALSYYPGNPAFARAVHVASALEEAS